MAYYFVLAIKSRSLTYFTATNPGIPFSGLFLAPKSQVLGQLDQQYRPWQRTFKSVKSLLKAIKSEDIDYPFVVKPEEGERGKGVFLIRDKIDLNYLNPGKPYPIIVQEFIGFSEEYGVFVQKLPGKDLQVTSLSGKVFLNVTGDGKSNLKELIHGIDRGKHRTEFFLEYHRKGLQKVLDQGEKLLIEPIGNHNRGTIFTDLNAKLEDQIFRDKINKVFQDITKPVDGFYYGRLDVKAENLESLLSGENLKVLEINGVNSEPTHIYDPSSKWIPSLVYILSNMTNVYKIARANNRAGVEYMSAYNFWKGLRSFQREG
jgi:hypothetical protein